MTRTLDQMMADSAPSVGEMLRRRAAESASREALKYRGPDGSWQSFTWGEVENYAREMAAGLIALGVEHEDRVAIASNTRMEWIIADLAVMCAAAATTTVYPTTKGEDVAFILSDAKVKVAIVENAEQSDKMIAQREHHNVHAIVQMDGSHDNEMVHTWEGLRELGRAHLMDHPDAVDEAIDSTHHDSLSTLIYTSGTTGRPKGVRLNHSVWAYEAIGVEELGIITQDDVHFLWLPLSHVFGKCLITVWVSSGMLTAVDGDLTRIVQGLGEVKPTIMAGAPRIFEKVRNTVMIGNATGIKSVIARKAFSVGMKTIPYRVAGKKVPPLLAAQYAVADKLVFSKLKAKMGGRVKFFVSGSAKLNAQVQRWFWAAGINLIEGYGLTETGAITFVNDYRKPALGTVGPVLPGTEAKIADDGEILVRGPGVTSGYENMAEATEESFSDGWFHTGDIGELDEQGNLRITDRKKDLIKTSGGKFVAPQKVEGALLANCPYISQAVVTGEGRKYISALVVLDPDSIAGWGNSKGYEGMPYSELTQLEHTRRMLNHYVERANERLERWETVKKFTVLNHELTVDDDEVTPSMKIRRGAVEKKYSDLIEQMYDKAEANGDGN
ncbi:AMP-dependent synthetase/ligase [Enemella sp. A6]|uniref:AMP-dependent synthetase/ligase n=1 Tax=Enemella sp. A6 TaxID=3440152 RepID=UPI003EB71EA2